MDELIDEAFSSVAHLFKMKTKYNLLSKSTSFRYSYCLNRLKSYLNNKDFKNIDELILHISDWKTNSSISSTIKNKFIDVIFIIYKNK